MSYRNNIDKLMQMATLDQLNFMIQQLNTNTNINTNTNTDILSLPIVQKVIIAYEEELKLKQTVETKCNCNCRCKDIEYRFDDIFLKHDEQIFEMERKIQDLTNIINTVEREKVPLIVADTSRGTQLKLSSFPGFTKTQNIIDLTDIDLDTEDKQIVKIKSEILVTQQNTEENITLRIEEQEQSQDHTVELINIISNLESYDVDNESTEVDVVEEEEDETAVEEEETAVEEEEVDVIEEDDHETAVEEEETAVEVDVVEEEDDETVVEEEETSVEEEEVDVVEEETAVEEEETAVEEQDSDDEVGTEEEEQDIKDETEEDVDEEVFEIEIDDVTYFATDEENGILYEVDKDGEVGKQVGIIKDGEPIFS
jgi:hypothetical protein